jgi:integrase
MPKVLSDAVVRNIKPSGKGRHEIADLACRGLRFRTTPNGERTFSFRYRDRATHRWERLPIGRYPDVSLRQARARADELRREVAAGRSPAEHRRGAETRTFAALAARYLIEHARRHKRSANADERMLRKHLLPRWARRDFTLLGRADLIQLVESIIADGKPIMANRVQALVSSIFSFAVDASLVAANPFLRLRKRGVERAKTRILSDDEIRLFWAHTAKAPVSRGLGLALKIVLATGCRPGEASGITKAELTFDNNLRPVSWLIPAPRTKNKRAHFVPLSELTTALMIEALTLARNSAYLFPSPTVDESITSHALSVAMGRIGSALSAGEAGVDTWLTEPPTPHDLRRTVATRLSAAGVAGEDVAAILNHTRRDVTGRHYDQYARAKEKAAALGRWSAQLRAILGSPEDNIIPLRAVTGFGY